MRSAAALRGLGAQEGPGRTAHPGAARNSFAPLSSSFREASSGALVAWQATAEHIARCACAPRSHLASLVFARCLALKALSGLPLSEARLCQTFLSFSAASGEGAPLAVGPSPRSESPCGRLSFLSPQHAAEFPRLWIAGYGPAMQDAWSSRLEVREIVETRLRELSPCGPSLAGDGTQAWIKTCWTSRPLPRQATEELPQDLDIASIVRHVEARGVYRHGMT